MQKKASNCLYLKTKSTNHEVFFGGKKGNVLSVTACLVILQTAAFNFERVIFLSLLQLQ